MGRHKKKEPLRDILRSFRLTKEENKLVKKACEKDFSLFARKAVLKQAERKKA